MTPAQLLDRELRRDGSRPFVTWYDDGTGDRVELSVSTLANWVAKTANLLVDELDIGVGDRLAVSEPSHWLSLICYLAGWTVGANVGASPADVTVPDEPTAFQRSVLAQPDVVVNTVAVPGDAPALTLEARTWSYEQLGAAAERAASLHGLSRGCRVLSTLRLDTVDGLDAGLLLPLAAGGSVVLVRDANTGKLAERCKVERVTHAAGVQVAGIERLDG